MKNSILILALLVAVCQAYVPPGYEKIPGVGIYRFHGTMKKWEDAKRTCESENAHLAVINDLAESEALKQLFVRKRTSAMGYMAHIGFEDKDADGDYRTVIGGSISGSGMFNIWKYPKQTKNKVPTCGGMWTCGRLTDTNCEAKHAFICEYERNRK